MSHPSAELVMMTRAFREFPSPLRASTALEVAALGQHGLFTAKQALELGVSASALHRRSTNGVWERVEPGVYRVAPYEPGWVQQLHAACLSAESGLVASHRAAACLWRLDGVVPGLVELSAPRECGYRRHTVHHVRDLAAVDMAAIDGIPTTTLARTLVDLGAVVDDDVLERAVESAFRQGLSQARLRWRLEALGGRGRPGPAALRRVLDRRLAGTAATESELETRFLQLIRSSELPPPIRQFVVQHDGRFVARLDFAYPDRRLAIELDGYATHAERATFDRDRTRQNQLVLMGWTVLRFTWADVTERPEAVVASVQEAGGWIDHPPARLLVDHEDQGHQPLAG